MKNTKWKNIVASAVLMAGALLGVHTHAQMPADSDTFGLEPPPMPPPEPTKHYMVITSDPQFPRTPNGYDDGTAERSRAISAIRSQYHNIQDYRASHGGTTDTPVFVNGDLTEFGDHSTGISRPTHLRVMKDSAFPILGPNVWLGLGNHDYDNNVDDCADNGCAGGMLEWFGSWLKGQPTMDRDLSEDAYYSPPFGKKYVKKGSYSYSKEFKHFTIIQLNSSPTYTTSFGTGTCGAGDCHKYHILDSMDWLERQLENAKKIHKRPIVMMHRPYDSLNGDDKKRKFSQLMNKYEVVAVFAGHTHSMSTGMQFIPDTRTPYFNSGATFDGNYLTVEYAALGVSPIYFEVYGVKNNNHAAKTLIGEFSIPDMDYGL